MASDLETRLEQLAQQGVRIVDPRQTFVREDVRLERIARGSVLHPGARLCGAQAWLGPEAELGTEGPATLVDSALGAGANVASGYIEGSVLLAGAKAGAGSHFRAGTLLEEEASTAHTVGLKQTILLSFVTLGSLINFCDVLMAGGTSRRDHSEVGSGFVHFNFTPWGAAGDKATPSLVGDVLHGVFLRQRRIFLGGAGGLVGPRQVGYGALSAAGSVLRRDVPARTLVMEASRSVSRAFAPGALDDSRRARPNVLYLANLAALIAWYRNVRCARAAAFDAAAQSPVLAMALDLLDGAVRERRARLAQFLEERGATPPTWSEPESAACPLDLTRGAELSHVEWVRGLSDADVEAGSQWLASVANDVIQQVDASLRPDLL